MAEPVLKISPKKYTGETTIVSMRMAKDLLKDIDNIANLTGRNRNVSYENSQSPKDGHGNN